MLKEKIKSCNSESTDILDRIIDNQSISLVRISKNKASNEKYSQQPLKETKHLPIQEVRHVKQEVFDVNESSNYEMSEYSDYDTTYIDDKSASEIFFAESINFEAAYAGQAISPEEMNDLAQLYDLIDFTCTKCRKTWKNPDYFVKKTGLQCSDCQATMKFQCPRCKLMFRNFDSAVRHAKQSCPIGESTSLIPTSLVERRAKGETRICQSCNFSSYNMMEFRNHLREKHPNDELVYACSVCSRRYKTRDSLSKHERLCGREPHIVCVFCGYRTKRREHLRVHMRHKHPDPESCHGGGYECPHCNKKYKYLLPLRSHSKNCGMKKSESAVVGKSEEVQATVDDGTE